MNVNQNEWSILVALIRLSHAPSEQFYPFAPIMNAVSLPRALVRRACRSLKRKGLVEYSNGLTNEDGEFRGAGYAITKEGYEYVRSLNFRLASFGQS